MGVFRKLSGNRAKMMSEMKMFGVYGNALIENFKLKMALAVRKINVSQEKAFNENQITTDSSRINF